MTTVGNLSHTPDRDVRGPRCGLGPTGQAIAGYAAFFAVALSLFGAMVLLSLLP